MAFLDFLSPIFGKKPQIADYTPVDLTDEQLKAITGNIENFPQIAELGNLYQSYILNAYETAIPGFKDILKMGGTTTKEMLDVSEKYLRGEIPEDVQGVVQRTSAYQNLLSGGGGGMASANVARNYGLTSLDLVSKGAALAGQAGNAAQRWAALSGAELPQGMLVTPQQMAQLDMQQNLIKRNILQQKYNVEAAPDPVAKGLSDIVENLTAAYLGGKVGKIGAGNAPATEAAGGISYYGEGTAPSGAFGPSMESAWAGTDEFGNPVASGGAMNAGDGGGGGGGSVPTVGTAYNPYGAGFAYGAGYPAANESDYYRGRNPYFYNPFNT